MMGQQHFMNHHLGTYMKNSINKIENKKNLNEGNFYFPVMENYSKLDDEFIIAYHPSLGVLCDEWMNMLVRYGTTRGRDLYFGVNSWGMVTCYFDVATLKDARKKYGEVKFPPPRKNMV
tara:strand:+ start:241 stop:597 length:357 start_codon:yes stop_codon:yes gene_type:complete